MAVPARTLHLYTPGLAAELTAEESSGVAVAGLQAMQSILARAARLPSAAGLTAQLLRGFAAPGDAGVAALTHFADVGSGREHVWLRADPVYLQADQDRVLLFAADALALDPREAADLCALLNEHFRDRDWRFEAPLAQRWYLRLPGPPELESVPLADAVGRDIRNRMPQGVQGAMWRAALNEVQMLLYGCAVNQARESRGALPVNSVWFWGEGALPEGLRSSWVSVCSDEPLTRGLTGIAGGRALPLPSGYAQWSADAAAGDHLVVCDDLASRHAAGDLKGWQDAVVRLESDWLAPARQALRRGALQRLRWWPGGELMYEIDRFKLRRFWRRAVPLIDLVQRA